MSEQTKEQQAAQAAYDAKQARIKELVTELSTLQGRDLMVHKAPNGTLVLTGVQPRENPQRSGKEKDGKSYVVIHQAIAVKGLLPQDKGRECSIRIGCYPAFDPNAGSDAIDLG